MPPAVRSWPKCSIDRHQHLLGKKATHFPVLGGHLSTEDDSSVETGIPEGAASEESTGRRGGKIVATGYPREGAAA